MTGVPSPCPLAGLNRELYSDLPAPEASTRAVALEEVRTSMAGMALGLAGVPLEIQLLSEAPFTLANPLRLCPSGDGRRLFLPVRVDFFPEREENRRLYRLFTAFQAAQWEGGTFHRRGKRNGEKEPLGWTLKFLLGFSRPMLAAEVFFAVDAGRLGYFLRTRYAGLSEELDWLYETIFGSSEGGFVGPFTEAVFGLHQVMAGFPPPSTVFPAAGEALAAAHAESAAIAQPGAGLAASARVTTRLYPLFEKLLLAGSGWGGRYDAGNWLDPLLARKQGGETTGESYNVEEGGAMFEELLGDLEALEDLEIIQAGEELDAGGSFITDTDLPKYAGEEAAEPAPRRDGRLRANPDAPEPDGKPFRYQEWNYLEKRYLKDWVRLFEVEQGEGDAAVVDEIVTEQRELIDEVRRQFRLLRADSVAWRKKLEAGDEVDIWELLNALVDRRAGVHPSEKLFMERRVRERDICALILLDMSASTDTQVGRHGEDDMGPQRKVIDIAREGLIVMAEALEQLGDSYALFGFSGYGRLNVEYYPIKFFGESLDTTVKARIASVEPKKSTRMGPAIRHSISLLERQGAREKLLIIISDGYPQDYDYGDDRRSKEYGLQDTRAALREAEARNIKPFCLTIDLAGYDYLKRICKPAGYMVVEDVLDLPQELPKIYKRLRA